MRNRNYFVTLLCVVILLSTVVTACCPRPPVRTRTPTPAPTSTPAPAPTPTPAEPLPPQVIQVTPTRGEEHPLEAPVQVLFDQPMDPASVEAAFAIEPVITGGIEWSTERLMQFTPSGEGFDRATRYTVTIADDAQSKKGLKLDAPVSFRFTTVGFLEVAAVTPVEDTVEVATDASVTVLFNRPVVPLSAVEDQGNLPQPLTFVPPVHGAGEWLNTAIYVFTPDEGFEPATTYKARIAAGLGDTTGGVLPEDFTWTFTTIMPAIVGTHPDADTIYVSTEPAIHIAFNQPMDRASAEAAFNLKHLATGEEVGGTFEWHDAGLVLPRGSTYTPYRWTWSQGEGAERVGVETMSFTPLQPLDFGAAYRAGVDRGAMAARGSVGTATPYYWVFDTIAYPQVLSTDPADGDTRARPWGDLEITFSSPMDPESIRDNFTIRPIVSATQVYTYWWDNHTKLDISFPIDPNTDYEVTLSGELRGRYGQPLDQDTTIRWRTRALDPLVDLHAPFRIGTYNAYTETALYVTARNVRRVSFALYDMPLKEFLRANGEDSWEYWDDYRGNADTLARRWSLEVAPPLNQRRTYRVNLAGEAEAALEPGLYYLEVWADSEHVYPEALPAGPSEVEREILVLSRHSLSFKTTPGSPDSGATASEALVWATDLRSGDVLPGLPVVVLDEHASVLAEGRTGGDGVFFARNMPPNDRWSPVFAFAGDPEDLGQDFAVTINQWEDGISPWRFDLPVESDPRPYAAHFFTDRPIYRPGQTVYFKGIVREDDDAHYALPTPGSAVEIAIIDAQGTKVFEDRLPVSDMGTLDGEFNLSEEAAIGYYTIDAVYDDQYFGAGFQVAEYRRPEFQVTVETDRPEYAHAERINVTAQATYFFGGPVAGAQVRYTVLSADHFFNYQGQGWWDFIDYDYSRSGGGYYGERIAEGRGTTDGQGRFTFSVAADIAETIASQRFTLEVSVTDVNNQEVSNRTEAVVHKGLFYIGLRPEQYVGQVDRENSVDIITVDWASEPSPQRQLTVVFAEHNWYSVKKEAEDGRFYWESTYEDVPVFTTTVETSRQALAAASFIPQKGGTYKVIATGLDEKDNEVTSSTFIWVSGRRYVSWRQENNDRITLVADKRQYQVGDTASILVPHPFQGPVKALVTIERGHIYRHWVQTLETNSEQLEIPITQDLIPNVFVSVVIVKGVDETTASPDFKLGYLELPIETTEKELSIRVTPDKPADEHYEPGQTVTYDLRVTDSAGSAVQAELALSLVDLSVLSLADVRGPDLIGYFWRQRGLSVQTANPLTLSGDRLSEALATEAKGLGGGGGAEEFGAVRLRFPDTAYWNPTLRTDERGRATVSVELPDNLTTWRLGARGITADTLVGQTHLDVISSKDLLVRPVAPRFFVVGDQAELAAVVHNNTDFPLEANLVFEADGLQIAGPGEGLCCSIPANDNTKVTWQVTVKDVPEVTLRFRARSVDQAVNARTAGVGAPGRALADAIEITLPVFRSATPEVVATAGQFEDDGQRLEAVILPPGHDPAQGELSIQVDPSLAAGMADGLDYLAHFPYECTEQTVSRFLPNVVTYRALEQLGLDRSELDAQLSEKVGVGLQRLYNQQHYDGGWGWWILDESDPFVSTYVLLGMAEAKRAGFTVDSGVLQRAAAYLKESLVTPRDLEAHWQANRQAFILYALAEARQGDLGRTVALFDRRDALDTFGKAYLAMALGLLEPDEPTRVQTLLSDITSEAIVSATGAHWEELQPDTYSMNTDTRSTAIVLAALARLDPDHALAPNAVRWLMAVRRAGHWETTQETAWAIIGLTDWMVATGELEGAYNWHVVVNGELLGEGEVTPENVDQTVQLQVEVAELLADEANRIVIERWAPTGAATGTGRLYYGLTMRTFKPAEQVTALNRGVIVSRRYTRADCDPEEETCPAVDQAAVGDVIRVKLTIIAPNDLHYVVVEDPFPAGAEGVDQSLKTTSVVGEPPELERTDQRTPWGESYGWWWFSHTDLRDEKAVLFATFLPRGTYEYTYLVRASLPGRYRVIPTHAYEMYFPEVFGRSDGGTFSITGEE